MGRDKNGASTHDRSMALSSTLSWLVDAAAEAAGADRVLAELGAHLLADGLPLAGGALTLAVPHPLIARRTWLWRADSREVIEALGFAPGAPVAVQESDSPNNAGRRWLATIAAGVVHEDAIGPKNDGPLLSWIGPHAFTPSEIDNLRQAARFAASPARRPRGARYVDGGPGSLSRPAQRGAGAGGTLTPRYRRNHPGGTPLRRSARIHGAIR